MSLGQKLITVYFIVTYGLPMAGNLLFREHIFTIYKIFPLTFYSIALIGGTYLLFLVLSTSKLRVLPKLNIDALSRILGQIGATYLRARLFVALIALSLAIGYFSAGLNTYRYGEQSISEINSSLLLLANILNIIIMMDLFYCMFVRAAEPSNAFTRRKAENVVLSLSLVLSANGTANMLQALLASIYSLFPRLFRRVTFVAKDERKLKKLIWSVVSVITIFFSFSVAWICGEAIKNSASGNISVLTAGGNMIEEISTNYELIKNYFYYLIASLSSYYYSLLFTAESPSDVLNYGSSSPLVFPLKTLLFRLDYLLGGFLDVRKPEMGSLSRLNYVLLTAESLRPREGSSPGLIGSFNYIFVFPLNIIFCAVYLLWLSNIIDVLFRQHKRETLSGFGILLLLLFLQIAFQSPFDFLEVFDDSVVYMALLLGIYVARKRLQGRNPYSVQRLRQSPAQLYS